MRAVAKRILTVSKTVVEEESRFLTQERFELLITSLGFIEISLI